MPESNPQNAAVPHASNSVGARDTVLGTLMVLLSGSPLLLPLGNVELTLIPSAILLACCYVLMDHPRTSKSDLLVFAIFAALTAVQVMSIHLASIYTAMGFFARLFIAFVVVRLATNWTILIVRVVTIFAVLADVMFALDSALNASGLDLTELLRPLSLPTGSDGGVYVVIHNFMADADRGRNAGIFWEPGALSGYCSLALILWGISRHSYSTRQSCVVVGSLVMAILSTFSTTGYILLPFVLLVPLISRTSVKLSRLLATALVGAPLLVVALVQISELSFVRGKIEQQVFNVGEEGKKWQLNRIGQLVNDIDDIAQRPLTGWGANPRIRPSAEVLDEQTQIAQGNGLSIFVVQYGLLGFAAFVFLAYRNFRHAANVSSLAAAYVVLLLCITLMGEAFLNYPLFLSLMFRPNREGAGLRVLVRWLSRAETVGLKSSVSA